MRVLSENDIVRTWEAGQRRPLWFKAVLLLARALPALKKSELAGMSLGRRNRYLFELRRRMVGSDIESLVYCPQCAEPLEFKVKAEDIYAAGPQPPGDREFSFSFAGVNLKVRPLNSRDAALAAACPDADTGRELLLRRCILEAEENGKPVKPEDLSEEVTNALGEQMPATFDPLAEIQLRLDCPACGNDWLAEFDIVAYFWSEIDAQAQRLLDDVHVLARAYGWSEADIFALSASRKQYYLELVT